MIMSKSKLRKSPDCGKKQLRRFSLFTELFYATRARAALSAA
jgi:hypothetical protein